MSELIKRGIKKRWPKEVTAALQTYYPGEAALSALERETSGPAHMAMILRLAAIAHQQAYPEDVAAAHRGRIH